MENLKRYGFLINPMQYKRVRESAVQFPVGSYVIDNNLEMGSLRIFDMVGKAISLQMLSDSRYIGNYCCAEVIINNLWKDQDITEDERLWIHKIHCNMGYEEWTAPMLFEVMGFAEFYGYESICMGKEAYEAWIKAIPEDTEKFHEENRVYTIEAEAR